MQTRTIRGGCSFRMPDGSLKTGGDQIELEDDVAQAHADKLEPLPADVQTPAQDADD
jgi:hypothetical protein